MKKFLVLLCALSLLVCLTACGESEKDAANPNDSAGNPAMDIFGGGSNNNDNIGDSEEARQAALYRKYEDIIERLENKRWADAVQLIAELSNEGKEIGDKTPLDQLFENVWYHYSKNENYTLPETLQISKGNVTLGETVYTFLEQSNSDTYITGWLLKDGIKTYFIECGKNKDDNVAVITVYTVKTVANEVRSDEVAAYYCNLPLVGELFPTWYNLDDTQKDMPKYFHFSRKLAYIGDEELVWTVDSLDDKSLSVKAEDKYTFSIEVRGDYLMGVLTEIATGKTANYYSNPYGYDRSWNEFIYPRTVQYLNECISDAEKGYTVSFTSHLEEKGVSFSDNNAWKKLYELFSALGNYRDSAEYLSRFTVLRDMFTTVKETTVDNMGNERTSSIADTKYNRLGQVTESYAIAEVFRTYGGTHDRKYFTYDADGTLTQIREGNISALIDLRYDQNGRLAGGTYKNNTTNQELSYTYDAQGRLAENIVWQNNDRYHHTYTYDQNGRLTKLVVWYGWGSELQRKRTTTTFEYDAQGNLMREVQQDESYSRYNDSFSLNSTVTITYEYGANGKIEKASYNEDRTSGTLSWASKVRNYIYEDLYYFD